MKTLALSDNDKTTISDMYINAHEIENAVRLLNDSLELHRQAGSKYAGVLETELDLAELCLSQISVSVSDVLRYIRNLNVLTT